VTQPAPYPDTPEHRAAHSAAQRANSLGWRPVICADEHGHIVVLCAFTPDQLDRVLFDADVGAQVASNAELAAETARATAARRTRP